MATIRICVCGDEGTGKSSLITSLVKNTYVSKRIQAVLPQISIPPSIGTLEHTNTVIIDTSALPQERDILNREIRKANVILLVYADHYSYERIALFWLPHFRTLGVNLPVVLCANKSDLVPEVTLDQVVDEEMQPVMVEFKEVDSCIRASARDHHNVNETFFLCQKAVTDPVAPLWDAKESNLKPACISALRRIFHLSDRDQDGLLSDDELQEFQNRCFGKPLSMLDLQNIKQSIESAPEGGIRDGKITQAGFVYLNQLFTEKARHETVWIILRSFHYTNSLSLAPRYLTPKLDLHVNSSTELSPAGYRFFVDLFLLHDKNNDGGLSADELASLFAPTPGLPPSWADDFPSSTISDEGGHITLQGWLSQWSLTTFFEPKTTLAYLAYLGYDTPDHNTVSAIKITKPRNKRTARLTRKRLEQTERNVLFAYLIGPPGTGKSALLDSFLARPFSHTYHPTIRPRTAVNSVELPGGKQCTLIMQELGELEPAILENATKLSSADLLVFAYDSSDPNSFSYISTLWSKYEASLQVMPSLYVALKADMDLCTQSGEIQPEQFTADLGVRPPLHTSVTWTSVSEVFVTIAEAALHPASVIPMTQQEREAEAYDWSPWLIVGGATVVMGAVGLGFWRKLAKD